jgi:ATP adenylyltransferase
LAYIKAEAVAPQPALPKLLPGGDADCFICRDVVESNDRENLVLARTARTVTILNRYPYNNGHLLVAPQLHQGSLAEIDRATQVELMETITQMVEVLIKTLGSEGFNIGLNLGRIAGAGLPGHMHWHIVPRWNGDANFMPVLAGIKVIPQSLDALWEILTDALKSQDG